MPDSSITKNALAASMKKLMAEMPFSKISVGDICEACGMNRKSFYYHFKDKYDLVNWIFETDFIDVVRLSEYSIGWDLLEDICRYFYRERVFYRNALRITGQNSFPEFFSVSIRPFIIRFTQEIYQGVNDEEFYVSFFGDAFLVAMIRWLTEEPQIPPEEFLAQCKKILVLLAKQVLQDLEKEDKGRED